MLSDNADSYLHRKYEELDKLDTDFKNGLLSAIQFEDLKNIYAKIEKLCAKIDALKKVSKIN